ncbi:energy transducer TonB [Novosphingobium olei]|uniref:Energy transducer TonB n=1 Tax=Novosphingobium olei TaxID=2728851 RepID=A0A7Y0BMF8_9SPHN|nr:energy transducer TonB [Novosphingobium olei]NML93176.1 energy transducer TonB [Novosphingobium olei]
MGYGAERGGRGRLGAGAAVIALHVGLGAALLSTFAGGIITRVIDRGLDNQNWIWMPPPPKPPKPEPSPRTAARAHTDSTAPRTPLDPLVPSTDTRTLDPGPLLPPLGPIDLGPKEPFLKPDPSPTPTGPATAARAKGDPGSWITRNDYPTRAIREEWTGVTRLRLSIGTDGRPSGCEVTASSGHPELDTVACDRVTRRARFEPARSSEGTAMPGAYETAVRWVLQD